MAVIWMAPVDGALAVETYYATAALTAVDSQMLVHR